MLEKDLKKLLEIKKRYERYFINYGRAYAEVFIKALTWLEEVPFDIEVEEAFENLRNK